MNNTEVIIEQIPCDVARERNCPFLRLAEKLNPELKILRFKITYPSGFMRLVEFTTSYINHIGSVRECVRLLNYETTK